MYHEMLYKDDKVLSAWRSVNVMMENMNFLPGDEMW